MMNEISFIAIVGTSILIAVLIQVLGGITFAEAASVGSNTTGASGNIISSGSNVTSSTIAPSSGFSSDNTGSPGRCGSSIIPSSSCGAFGSGD